jgi:hypothetical protein
MRSGRDGAEFAGKERLEPGQRRQASQYFVTPHLRIQYVEPVAARQNLTCKAYAKVPLHVMTRLDLKMPYHFDASRAFNPRIVR